MCRLDLLEVRESVMPFLLQDRCRRILQLKERSSILALWIRKKLLIGFPREVISWELKNG